jgi:hypothetical protein
MGSARSYRRAADEGALSRAHLGWMPFRMQSLRKSASLS